MPDKKSGFRRISDEAVRSKTGKDWAEWFGILDEWDMHGKGHTLTARYLDEQFHVGWVVGTGNNHPL